MTPEAEEYLVALKSLLAPAYYEEIDVLIESQAEAMEAFNQLINELLYYKIDVKHLYYIGDRYVKDGYYYTEYEEKEEWEEYEPTYMEEFGKYPKYKKTYTSVPVERYVDNGGHYEEEVYKVKRVEVNILSSSFKFYCEGDYTFTKSFGRKGFTYFYVKTNGKGKTYFSSDEIASDEID